MVEFTSGNRAKSRCKYTKSGPERKSLFLYNHVLKKELVDFGPMERAKRPKIAGCPDRKRGCDGFGISHGYIRPDGLIALWQRIAVDGVFATLEYGKRGGTLEKKQIYPNSRADRGPFNGLPRLPTQSLGLCARFNLCSA